MEDDLEDLCDKISLIGGEKVGITVTEGEFAEGRESKRGVWWAELEECERLIKKHLKPCWLGYGGWQGRWYSKKF